MFKRGAVLLFAFTLFATISSAQQNSLVGTWRVTEIALPNQPKITSPQPGLHIYTAKHYSIVRINSDKPGVRYAERAKAKDSDIIAIYDALTAQSGSYTVSGDSLKTRPIVAKSPIVMDGPEISYQFSIAGKTLTLTTKPADGSAPAVYKLTRLE